MKQLLLTFTLFSFLYGTPVFAYSVSQAKEDMKLERYSTVIENLRQLVDQDQSNYEAWFLFGVAHVHEQQYHQAIEAFRQVIALRPKLAEPHNNLAAVYNNLGDTKSAVKELEKALEKRPNYIIAEENLADLYIKLALQHYRNTLQHSPNPMIEQRYARLIKVRNPMSDADIAATETTQDKPAAAPATQAIQAEKPTVAQSAPHITTVATNQSSPKKMPTPVVASAPQQQPAQATAHNNLDDVSITGVLDALERWRNAWASQDLDSYFMAYADDYQPDARFSSVDAWKAYKTRVIKNKTFIRITFEQVEVNFDNDKNLATVMLLQRFNSNSYNGKDFKRITFKHTPNGWKIVTEASIK